VLFRSLVVKIVSIPFLVGHTSFLLLLNAMKRLLLLLPVLCFDATEASRPDAEIHFNNMTVELGRFANFGTRAAATGRLRKPPSNNPLLCNTKTEASSEGTYASDAILLTPRGNCSFELKTRIAQSYGAAGIFIYNNLQSRYRWNETFGRVEYPVNQQDYECSNGHDELSNFPLDPPKYQTSVHDPLLTLRNAANLCSIDGDQCPSGRCLVIGPAQSNITTACCAWDITTTMNYDSSLSDNDAPTIFAIFLTMTQADLFLTLQEGTQFYVSEREYPNFNASSFLLWLMATAIVAFAAWHSAGDYRRAKYKLTHPVPAIQAPPNQNVPTEVAAVSIDTQLEDQPMEIAPDEENHLELTEQPIQQEPPNETEHLPQPVESLLRQPDTPMETSSVRSPDANTRNPSPTHSPTPRRFIGWDRLHARLTTRNHSVVGVGRTANEIGSIELTVWHAAIFVIIASGMLFLLFFFQFYPVITVLYAIGCSGCVAQVLFRPLYSLIARLVKKYPCLQSPICPKMRVFSFNQLTWLEMVSGVSGHLLCGMWLFIWFTNTHPLSIPFYWITQNIMGTCLCILFLALLKLNSIKVATVLLLVVFIYDIFFVFITPLIFESSVMVTVATGGGGPEVSADYCEKYPDDSSCKASILPMLLILPKINDYRGGASLLGLGDIVLPGLLISFAARLDEAKRLVGGHTTLDIRIPSRGGFLLPLTFAYAIGLLFANLAVVWLDGGQPALMYLVPACLGTMICVGWYDLEDLWKGPKVIRWADNLVRYCDRHTFVATISDDEATVVDSDSVMDDDVLAVRDIT